MCFSLGLHQIVIDFTRIQQSSESVLDLVFFSDSLISRPHVVDILPGISDHSIVSVSLTLNPTRKETKIRSSYRDYNMADDTTILDELDIRFGPFEALGCQQSVSVTDLWLRFKALVHMCIKQYVPLKVKRKRVHNPWITRKVIQLKRKVKRRRGRLRQERCERSVNEITALSAALKSEIKESKHKYYNVTMLQFLKQSPQKFWRHFKKAKTCVSELSTEDGVTNDKQDIANEFNTFFASVFTIDNDEPVEFELPCSFPDAEDLTLSVEGIMTLLLELNTSK